MRLGLPVLNIIPVAAHARTYRSTGLLCLPAVTLKQDKSIRQYRQVQTWEELTVMAKSTGVQVSDNGVVAGLTTHRRWANCTEHHHWKSDRPASAA